MHEGTVNEKRSDAQEQASSFPTQYAIALPMQLAVLRPPCAALSGHDPMRLLAMRSRDTGYAR